MAASERADPHAFGLLLRTPSLRSFWALNSLLVEGPQPQLDAETLVGALERAHPAGSTLRAFVTDDATGRRLAPGLERSCFRVTREIVMVQRGDADRATPPGLARVAAEDDLAAAEAAVMRDDGVGPATLALVGRGRARARDAAPAVVRVVGATDGRDAATATAYHDGVTAFIADVATVHEARGRGLARAVLGVAVERVRAAGCDVVGLTADADDWPRQLYRKLGFAVVGQVWSFLRPGAAAAAR